MSEEAKNWFSKSGPVMTLFVLAAWIPLAAYGAPEKTSPAQKTEVGTKTAVTPPGDLTPEMVVSLRSAISPAVSPDGKRVVYVLQTPRTSNEELGKARKEIWMRDLDPGESGNGRQWTAGPSDESPAFSPEGTWVGFLGTRGGKDSKAQVYLMPAVGGGEPRQLTRAKAGVSSFAWSPDGKRLAWLAKEPKSDEREAKEKKGEDWEVVDRAFQRSRLWVGGVEGKNEKQIPIGELSAFELDWSPDGKVIAFTAADTPSIDDSYMRKRLYVVPVDGAGEARSVWDPKAKLGSPRWNPEGTKIAINAGADTHDPSAGILFVVDPADGTATNLTKRWDGTVGELIWNISGRIDFTAAKGIRNVAASVAAGAGDVSVRVDGPIDISHLAASKDVKFFVASASRFDHPRELYQIPLDGKAARRLTSSNPELDVIHFAKPEAVKWKAQDGLEIEGVLYRPDLVKGPAPLVVEVHGGPESIYTDGWTTGYLPCTQLLTRRGFAILLPNYRGSTGRGVDYGKADQKDLGGKEFEDVLAGIDELAKQGIVDPKRVGMMGGSYGGYFSGLAATRYTDRFRAAIPFAGVHDWESFLGTTEIPTENELVHWNLDCLDETPLCWDRSPVSSAKRSKTATLITHGLSDPRVPPSQSRELYWALRKSGSPVELVVYPRELHGLTERAHQLDHIQRVIDWMEKYVQNAR